MASIDIPSLLGPPETGNAVAPEGQVFVCVACGKTSKDRYGYQKISSGWDESCMLNAVLCYTEKQDGKWIAVSAASGTP